MGSLDRILAQIIGLCVRNPLLEEDAKQLEALHRNQQKYTRNIQKYETCTDRKEQVL
jgi:hypothetical protein